MLKNAKYYLRGSAPVWLYRLASEVRHIPLHARRLLGLSARQPLSEKVYHTVTVGGHSLTILLDPANGLVDTMIYNDSIWEPTVTDCLIGWLQPGDVFVDVGANIGYYSLLASKVVGETGKVIACEPIPSLADQIKQSVTKNALQNVTIVPYACGTKTEQVQIGKYDENIGKSSLFDGDIDNVSTETVSVRPLDDILAQTQRVDVIKIDVEGYEPYVLLGAQQTIATHRPNILFEFNPGRLHRQTGQADALLTDLFTLLQQEQYEISSIKGEPITNWQTFTQRQKRIGSYVELLCVPR